MAAAACSYCCTGPSSVAYMQKIQLGGSSRAAVLSCILGKGLRLGHRNQLLLLSRSGSTSAGSYGWIETMRRRRKASSFRPTMEWQDCSSEMEVHVPSSAAYQCYADRETIPEWMPFIDSVKIVEDKPDLSRWTLRYEFLGRDVEFSWLARNMQPIPNQKIHWRSLEGLPNRGAVRFFPTGPSSCRVQLTVSYEVPEILAPVASALKPFLEGLLLQGLERFAVVAKARHEKAAAR